MDRRAILLGGAAALLARQALAQPGSISRPAGLQQPGKLGPQPTGGGSLSGPTFDLSLTSGTLDAAVTFTRTSAATSGLYTDASGSSVTSYAANAPRMLPGGLLIEEARTNQLLNSAAPVTQTTASLGTGTYQLWVIGSGSATSSAGTATATGLGTAIAGTPNVFVVTVAGTITVTVTGSLDRFQCELGVFPTSFISTTGAVATRTLDSAAATITSLIGAETTMVVEATGLAALTAGNHTPASLHAGSNVTVMSFIRSSGTNTVNANLTVASSNVLTAAAGSLTAGTPFKAGFAAMAGTQRTAFNGIAGASGTAAMPSGMTTLGIGRSATSSYFNGYIRRVRLWSRMLSAAELAAATA